ncbi:MAG: hypothetical protein Q4E35_02795 [Eubacteriales bacterium]|nr:hypothetical protein [Eubacteriales bacterium]
MDFRQIVPADVPDYLSGFNRRKYGQFFKRYEELSRPFFEELEASGDAEGFAKEVEEQIHGSIKGLFKGRQYCDTQFFLMTYTAPAALKRGNETSAAFARELRDAWAKRHPDMAFQLADYDTFANGYNNTIFGFKVDWGNNK